MPIQAPSVDETVLEQQQKQQDVWYLVCCCWTSSQERIQSDSKVSR